MSLFDFFLKDRPKINKKVKIEPFKMFNGYQPKFTSFGGDIYESELVRAAINARATHISKLKFSISGSARQSLQNKLVKAPNQLQTWAQFLYRTSTILDVHNTAFIVPIYDQYGDVSGVFCPLPSNVTIVEAGENKKKLYLVYEFTFGQKAAIELENCGILTKYQYRSDFFGEKNDALLPTMDLIHIQNQGIQEAVKSSATYRFYASVTNFLDDEDLANERQRFSEANFSKDANGGGLLLFPNTYKDINQVKSDPYTVAADEMKLIEKNVYQYFMVNEDVLQNKAYGDSWSAFYEGAIEPFAIQFSEVMTKMLFTLREQSQGNIVMLTANRLQYMTNADKLNVSSQLVDRGVISINDAREIWNLPPVDDGDIRFIRGEYWNVDDKVGDSNSTEESEDDA